MSTTRILVLLIAVALAAASSTACTATSCTRDPDSLTVPLLENENIEQGGEGGESSEPMGSEVQGNVYRSAPFGGPYTYFPPFRTATFEHGLGVIPYAVQFWLAFSPKGTLAPSAGNMTELRVADDGGVNALNKDSISVYNNTCSDFYLWVVAEGSGP